MSERCTLETAHSAYFRYPPTDIGDGRERAPRRVHRRVIAGLLRTDPAQRSAPTPPMLQALARRAVGVLAVPAPRRPTHNGARFRPATVTVTAAVRTNGGTPTPQTIQEPPVPARNRPVVGTRIALLAAAEPVAGRLAVACRSRRVCPARIAMMDLQSRCGRGVLLRSRRCPLLHRATRPPPTGDLLQHLQIAERQERAAGTLADYQKISMGVLLVPGGGADWEYTWQPATAPRLHIHRVVVAADSSRSYLLAWIAQDQD